MGDRSIPIEALVLYQRQYSQRATGSTFDLGRRRKNNCALRRQLVQVDEARQPEFIVAVHVAMARKRRIKGKRLPRICTNCLGPVADHIAFFREKLDYFL